MGPAGPHAAHIQQVGLGDQIITTQSTYHAAAHQQQDTSCTIYKSTRIKAQGGPAADVAAYSRPLRGTGGKAQQAGRR
jgi:hypothetical protein